MKGYRFRETREARDKRHMALNKPNAVSISILSLKIIISIIKRALHARYIISSSGGTLMIFQSVRIRMRITIYSHV